MMVLCCLVRQAPCKPIRAALNWQHQSQLPRLAELEIIKDARFQIPSCWFELIDGYASNEPVR
jgi:hypothetical protein